MVVGKPYERARQRVVTAALTFEVDVKARPAAGIGSGACTPSTCSGGGLGRLAWSESGSVGRHECLHPHREVVLAAIGDAPAVDAGDRAVFARAKDDLTSLRVARLADEDGCKAHRGAEVMR